MTQTATLALHVTPKAGRDEVVGVRILEDGLCEVEVRTTAAPDKGAANKSVCKLLAKEIGVPKSSVSVKRGDAARHKIVAIDTDAASVDAWVSSLPVVGV